ncbi:hypothetical protein N7510_010247 [Penicillium lagena]|uniref:uncharacterized protein n=1 Tax=Penicillium lagena TaxID=94218 RepID=UPI00254058F9|nr:uncharacterized protein N7510_010247 [Penicillium lagena]KAJ5605093.1 hypothetical protein N7510_010247 [Penicillium lagena]
MSAPPSYDESQAQHKAPPYHNWQEAIPDTATFPPPPVSGYYASGTGNASSDDADRAHAFCDNTPLWKPVRPSPAVYRAVQEYDIRPVQPRELSGWVVPQPLPAREWKGATADRNRDCAILTHLPLYFAAVDSPFERETSKTIYFEVTLLGLRTVPGADQSGFSIGFAAQPYPSWRSPGWERGSLGVCSDDGCRFVNDSWGGRDFTTAVNVGETVGIGMVFTLPDQISADSNDQRRCEAKVFFTRDGRRVGEWDLHEEVDAESGSVEGLEGDYDLYGAIGLFGGVDFKACFSPAGWRWNP